jgi:hypothetical protein
VPTITPGGAGGAPPATLMKAKRIGTTYRARVDCPQGCAARLTIRRHHRTVATKLITLIPGEHRVQVTYAKHAHRVVLHVRNPQSGNYVRRGVVHLP